MLEQRPQIPRRPPLRGTLQRPAGRHHHRDQRTGQVLPNRERAHQRQDREQTGTDAEHRRESHPQAFETTGCGHEINSGMCLLNPSQL